MKRCKGCLQDKQESQFKWHKDNTDHLTGKCSDCLKKQRQERESKRKHITPDAKICFRCSSNLPANHFIRNKTSKDGLNGWCRSCTKDSALLAKYNLSLNEYNELLRKQDGRCAICSTSDPKGPTSQFCVDHCHKTGRVRGLLCNHCNTGLGKLGDTIESLKKAIRYLELC
jgi:hypothetical protein